MNLANASGTARSPIRNQMLCYPTSLLIPSSENIDEERVVLSRRISAESQTGMSYRLPFAVATNSAKSQIENSSADSSSEQRPFVQKWAAADFRAGYGLVKAAFGMSVSELASVFGVSRKTLYSWIGEGDGLKMRPSNRKRFMTLEKVAQHAAKVLESPIGVDGMLDLGGDSFQNLVKQDVLNEEKIKSWIDLLVDRRSRLPDNNLNVMEKLKKSGLALPPGADAGAPIL